LSEPEEEEGGIVKIQDHEKMGSAKGRKMKAIKIAGNETMIVR
jgi:hypothetical protein